MTATALFGLTFGPPLLAVVLALLADMLGHHGVSRSAASVLLASGGAVALIGGWAEKPTEVFGAFAVGGAPSTIGGVVLLCCAAGLFATEEDRHALPALVSLAAVGAALALCARDVVGLLIALELAAMTSYAIVASGRTRDADEASVKYFIQGAVSTGLFVLGIALLTGLTGETSAAAAVEGAVSAPILGRSISLGVFALIAALAFKSGAAPFHSWAPDAYQHAPSSSAGVLSGGVKLGMLAALAALIGSIATSGASAQHPLGLLGFDLVGVLGGLALLSVVIGSTVALKTESYARMLGYAGVAQVGYALIAMASLVPSAAAVFIVAYAIAATGAFAAGSTFRRHVPQWDGSIEGMRGFGRRAPIASAALVVILMSMAGLPPLFGFWGKLQAFGFAIGSAARLAAAGEQATGIWLGSVAAVGILGSVVSLGYYGSVIRALYFAEPEDAAAPVVAERPIRSTTVVIASAVVLAILGSLPLVLGISATLSGFVSS